MKWNCRGFCMKSLDSKVHENVGNPTPLQTVQVSELIWTLFPTWSIEKFWSHRFIFSAALHWWVEMSCDNWSVESLQKFWINWMPRINIKARLNKLSFWVKLYCYNKSISQLKIQQGLPRFCIRMCWGCSELCGAAAALHWCLIARVGVVITSDPQ